MYGNNLESCFLAIVLLPLACLVSGEKMKMFKTSNGSVLPKNVIFISKEFSYSDVNLKVKPFETRAF